MFGERVVFQPSMPSCSQIFRSLAAHSFLEGLSKLGNSSQPFARVVFGKLELVAHDVILLTEVELAIGDHGMGP